MFPRKKKKKTFFPLDFVQQWSMAVCEYLSRGLFAESVKFARDKGDLRLAALVHAASGSNHVRDILRHCAHEDVSRTNFLLRQRFFLADRRRLFERFSTDDRRFVRRISRQRRKFRRSKSNDCLADGLCSSSAVTTNECSLLVFFIAFRLCSASPIFRRTRSRRSFATLKRRSKKSFGSSRSRLTDRRRPSICAGNC